MRKKIVERIESAKIVAIIRIVEESEVTVVVDNVIAAGLDVLEITSNMPDFCGAIQRAKRKFPQAVIGAGACGIGVGDSITTRDTICLTM